MTDSEESGARCLSPRTPPVSRHPGGLTMTEELFALAALPEGAEIGDVGCGEGASTAWLRQRGCRCTGVEPGENGRAEALPFADGSMDALLYECVLCLTDRDAALSEAWRALRPGGKLLVSDVYEQGTEPAFPGFRTLAFADRRREFISWLGQAILDDTPCDFPAETGKKYSYYMAVMEKDDTDNAG